VTPTRRYSGSILGTKVVGCYTDEKRAVKLVLAMLILAPERWNRGSFSWLNRQQLELLRRTLGVGIR
jgi:hypothetical protein